VTEKTATPKGKKISLFKEIAMTLAFGGVATGAVVHVNERDRQNLEALAERGFVPETGGQRALAAYMADTKPLRDNNPHIQALRQKPNTVFSRLYTPDAERDTSMDALKCDFEDTHYARDFNNMMAIVDTHRSDPVKNETIRECFWSAQSPQAFLQLEDRIYRDVLGKLARDPFVRERADEWKPSREYTSFGEAVHQYRIKQELVQYMSDHIRAAFGLPPVPVIIDQVNPNGTQIPRHIGGFFNSHMGEIGMIVLNPISPIGMDRSFKDVFSELLIEEVKHSIDYHIGFLALSGAYPQNHPFYYHGLMVSAGKHYNSSHANIKDETPEAARRRWKNYQSCFVERTAKALEKKVPAYFFASYESETPSAATRFLQRAGQTLQGLVTTRVSYSYVPGAAPA